MRYGLPYKGSKNSIAKWIAEQLPRARNFYDIFAGGCAVTHIAMLRGKYESYTANDITDAVRLFGDAIAGKYRDEKRWISREDFFRLKDVDPYVRICWSFGNDQHSYLYSRKLEPYKRALHYAIVFDDWREFSRLCPEVATACREHLRGIECIRERRVEIGKPLVKWLKECGTLEVFAANPLYRSCRVNTINKTRPLGAITGDKLLESLERLHSLESLERLERLQSLGRPQSLKILQGDYQSVSIQSNSVIYCDIPYQGTTGYLGAFDYERFFDWCERQQELVIVSEYGMPKDRFICIAEKKRTQHYSSYNNSQRKIERLFIPAHQKALYASMRLRDGLSDTPHFEMG